VSKRAGLSGFFRAVVPRPARPQLRKYVSSIRRPPDWLGTSELPHPFPHHLILQWIHYHKSSQRSRKQCHTLKFVSGFGWEVSLRRYCAQTARKSGWKLGRDVGIATIKIDNRLVF